MKPINFLTCTASLTLTAFIGALVVGVISMTLFLATAVTWIGLIMVYSYTAQTRTWLPRTVKSRLMAKAKEEKASLPLAA